MSARHFADRLVAAIKEKQTPLVVGIDPRLARLPYPEKETARTSPDIAMLYTRFGIDLIDLVADWVPAVKPQSAFFEQLGAPGVIALSNVVRHARSKGLLVIMDAKRGDIGSTAEAYAHAYLHSSSEEGLGSDALTVNPYLGDDSLTPFVKVAGENGNGIFVLAKTSNPGSKTFQELRFENKSLFEHVAEHLESLAGSSLGDCGYGYVGAVVGATHPAELVELRARMKHSFFLVPGYGAQGGSAADIAGAFDESGLGAVVNSSRGIIFAYEREEYLGQASWKDAVVAATRQAIEDIASGTNAGKLRLEKKSGSAG